MRSLWSISSLMLIMVIAACRTARPVANVTPAAPAADREFRAAWVATVANINWPSKPGLSTEEQQREAIVLLDFLKAHHFNAVVFQVRPQADALYQSNLEPWSYYLTGAQGKAPSPYYDPLTFWTEAAHDRGLELHVWLNPYRAHHIAGGEVSDSSVVKRFPNLVMKLKEGYWWFDPAQKGTQDHSAAVIRDIITRYDIDGVHFDDYFYPYPSYNGDEDFPDNESWAAYQRSGGKMSRGDWRRNAVNVFIERVYKEIKATKPNVKFGLSPFGTWRPGHPSTVVGFDQYDQLYADAKLWLNKGWIDYFTPQLYWPTTRLPLSFPVLLGWWINENTHGRHLWPGINVGADTGVVSVNETISQIMISRGMLPKSPGVVHWSISSDTRNTNLQKAMINGVYRSDALVPATPWLDNKPPVAPRVTIVPAGDSLGVHWSHADEGDVFRWVVYTKYGDKWSYRVYNRKDRQAIVEKQLSEVRVTAVDRMGNESAVASALPVRP